MNDTNLIKEPENRQKLNATDRKLSPTFELIRDIVFIIAAVLGVVAFFRTCMMENKYEKVSYLLASMDHQPKLKISKVKSSILIDTLSVRAEKDVLMHEGTNDDPHPFKVDVAFSAKLSMKIENVSDSSIGKIRLLLTTDKTVNFKKFFTDKTYRKNSEVHLTEWPELTNLQILPGESTTLGANAVIRRTEEKQFVLNIVIIYQNDFGNFYHTHTRIPFNFKSGYLKTVREAKISELEKDLREYIKEKLLNDELIMETGPVISRYSIYDEKESKKVEDYILSFKKGT
jgi:hypothetical protein